MVVTCVLRIFIAFLFYIPIESRLEEDVGVVLWPRIRNSFRYPCSRPCSGFGFLFGPLRHAPRASREAEAKKRRRRRRLWEVKQIVGLMIASLVHFAWMLGL